MAVRTISWISAALIILTGCTQYRHISRTDVTYTTVESHTTTDQDESIVALIAPYKEQIDAEMNEVIGNVARELTKRRPESTLGNFVGDAMMYGALKEDPEVSFAVSNYGGLRVNYLSPGALTKGKIFELSPFDNTLVIVEMNVSELDTLMQAIAGMGGWPISRGVKIIIHKDAPAEYTIHGKKPDPNAIYKVAMPDYIANGGDGLKHLISLERSQSGKLVRDIIMEYVGALTQKGESVDAAIEGRITETD